MGLVNKCQITTKQSMNRVHKFGDSWAPGPLFTKRTDVLPQDLAKSRSLKIHIQTFPIALKFDRHLDCSDAEMPVKFKSDTIIITPILAAPRLHEILRWDVRPLSE